MHASGHGAQPSPLCDAPAESIENTRGDLRLRRADASDIPFLVDLLNATHVEPFLAPVSASSSFDLGAELERSRADPAHSGRLIAEIGDEGWTRVGSVAYDVANRRSRIAYLSALAVASAHARRGHGVAVTQLAIQYLLRQVGYHRVQCEIYAFNERAIHVAEEAGFTREGVRRQAYWRRGSWIDGVLFGVVADE